MKTFIFDFDSTLFPGESLDEIIQFKLKDDAQSEEKSEEITNICNLGMTGKITMQESLKRRLDIATPTKELIEQYVAENKSRIDKLILKTLSALQKKGHLVFVVSGGFEEWIRPILSGTVPSENIHANTIKDASLPMTFDNIIQKNKEDIINKLIETRELSDNEITIVGDGATDFSVFENNIAKQFIGTFFYTGVSKRKEIIQKATAQSQQVFLVLDEFIQYITPDVKKG